MISLHGVLQPNLKKIRTLSIKRSLCMMHDVDLSNENIAPMAAKCSTTLLLIGWAAHSDINLLTVNMHTLNMMWSPYYFSIDLEMEII